MHGFHLGAQVSSHRPKINVNYPYMSVNVFLYISVLRLVTCSWFV